MRRALALLLPALPLLLAGCGVQSHSVLSRSYHTFNTRYNYLTNAEEAFNRTYRSALLSPSTQTDTLLPPLDVAAHVAYNAFVQHQPLSTFSQTVQKCRMAIEKHSLLSNDTEHNPAMGRIYLLLASSYFYEGRLPDAEALFLYLENLYIRDEPIKATVHCWLIRCRLLYGDVEEATRLMEDNRSSLSRNAPEWLYLLTEAELQLAAGNDAEALNHIRSLARYAPAVELKARAYLLAGLLNYRLGKKMQETNKNLRKAVNLPLVPADEVTAHLLLAGQNKKSEETIKRMFMKPRYATARPRLAYTLGQIYSEQGRYNEAEETFLSGIDSSTENQRVYVRKNLLGAANLCERRNSYDAASGYYRRWLETEPPQDTLYNRLLVRYAAIHDLLLNSAVIEREDSLLQVASMPPEEREHIIDSRIKAHRKQLLDEGSFDSREQNVRKAVENSYQDFSSDSAESFYFYNPQLVAAGRQLFERQWGYRLPEDHWQRKNKTVQRGGTIEQRETGNFTKAQTDPLHQDYYLAELPLTAEQKRAAQKRILKSLETMATIYRNSLQRPDLATRTEQECTRRQADFSKQSQPIK